jgi:hypothetical protein
MKSECTRRIVVPFRTEDMRRELALYGIWYNEHRPHMGLEGRVPEEVHRALPAAMDAPRLEPRARWPVDRESLRGKPGARLELRLRFLDGNRHLPVVELKHAG